jgi:glycosyltransferase involved in cell wall biosynthesis
MQIKPPHIIGLTKVRNESAIIKDTLDRWGEICTGGIIVLDDKSTDNTRDICWDHKAVYDVLEADFWDPDREKAEWFNRQTLLIRGKQIALPESWFVYFDADEHLYNFTEWGLFENPDVKAIACRLFDMYITPDDVSKKYTERKFVGPEFRTIVFFFRNMGGLKYHLPDQRAVTLPDSVGNIPIHGDIKHYGKGFSVEHWEETCDYYIKFWPKYADKWRKRKGKAIHEVSSDFGNPLIKWSEINSKKVFSLENMPYGKN